MNKSIVEVALHERSYQIHIGANLLCKAGDYIQAKAPKARAAIITEKRVDALHGETLRRSLQAVAMAHHTLVLEPGEATKSFENVQKICDFLLANKFERGDVLIALGGGVIGDLAGFAASILRRGMGFVQIPTTLLAQVDSSVGGKTGINTPYGKNLIGAFYQPLLVIADTQVLQTLPARDFAAGYAEVVKYGLINAPDFFAFLENNHASLMRKSLNDLSLLQQAIVFSCQSKADFVKRDERETGERALLNLGHTFGHALETLTHYDSNRLVHGEAIAIGQVLAFRYSATQNLCTWEDAARVEAHFRAVGLPTRLNEVRGGVGSVHDLMQAIAQDKKVSHGKLTFILTQGIGKAFIAKDVEKAKIEAYLTQELERNA